MKFLFLPLFIFIHFTAFGKGPDDSTHTICQRNLIIHSDKILVNIIIRKPKANGFARIYEKFPAGSEISKINCGKAVFKNEKNMLKIAWDDIPENEKIEISYEWRLNQGLSDTLNAIAGTFSAEFLPTDNDQIAILSGTKEYVRKPILEIVKVEEKKEIEKEEKKEVKKEEKKVEKTVLTEPSKNTQPLASADGIYICIQVAAVGSNIKSDYLKKQFGYEGEFESHFEENIYRITVGKFKSQAEAEAVLKEYKEKYFKKCFLSAYKDGHKIPVYEAEKLLN